MCVRRRCSDARVQCPPDPPSKTIRETAQTTGPRAAECGAPVRREAETERFRGWPTAAAAERNTQRMRNAPFPDAARFRAPELIPCRPMNSSSRSTTAGSLSSCAGLRRKIRSRETVNSLLERRDRQSRKFPANVLSAFSRRLKRPARFVEDHPGVAEVFAHQFRNRLARLKGRASMCSCASTSNTLRSLWDW